MKNSETGDLVIFFQKSHLPSLHCFPCNLTQNKAKKKKYFLLFLVVSKDPKQWKKRETKSEFRAQIEKLGYSGQHRANFRCD